MNSKKFRPWTGGVSPFPMSKKGVSMQELKNSEETRTLKKHPNSLYVLGGMIALDVLIRASLPCWVIHLRLECGHEILKVYWIAGVEQRSR